ncbi:hypothetical protein ACFYNO_12635, partial [Kitasatospora sp. NPDC006697]|uniref:hypothetical protein n=1 Tax=Kitasatospora sp. NPDC006697 TaxID=3364020 RepID=UPI0036C2721D
MREHQGVGDRAAVGEQPGTGEPENGIGRALSPFRPLDARRSTLDARRSTLDARRSTLDARRSTLDA